MTEKKVRIGIVGSGPAGLVTALGLEAYAPMERCSITLLDKNKTLNDYPGVEYGIQERACRALERLGIKERALHRGVWAHEITLYNSRIDKHAFKIKSNPDYTRCVVRQEFLNDLSALLQQTQVVTECQVKAYKTQADGTVVLQTEHSATQEAQAFTFDVVIACDGSFSQARKQFFPESATKIDRGFSCIYLLIEAPSFPQAAEKFLALANGGRSEIIMGTQAIMTLFPLGKNRLAYGISFDHATKKHLWAEQRLTPAADWKELSPSVKRKIAQALVADATPHEPMYRQALDYVSYWDSYKIYLWKMKDTDALERPFVANANLILIGDAAHALMPTIGMGASLAIQDAELLAQALAQHLQRCPTNKAFVETVRRRVFPKYAQQRVPVWKELLRRARLSAKENFLDLSTKKRFTLGPQIPNDALSRMVSAGEALLRRFNL